MRIARAIQSFVYLFLKSRVLVYLMGIYCLLNPDIDPMWIAWTMGAYFVILSDFSSALIGAPVSEKRKNVNHHEEEIEMFPVYESPSERILIGRAFLDSVPDLSIRGEFFAPAWLSIPEAYFGVLTSSCVNNLKSELEWLNSWCRVQVAYISVDANNPMKAFHIRFIADPSLALFADSAIFLPIGSKRMGGIREIITGIFDITVFDISLAQKLIGIEGNWWEN